MAVRSVYKFRLIRSVLWGLPALFLMRFSTILAAHANMCIETMELKEDGN